MLSWSSNEAGDQADLADVAAGVGGAGVEHGDVLLQFATACGERDDQRLATARDALIAVTDEAFMVDAAAVACNFEMMTRLADSTGSRMPADVLERRAPQIGVMGVSGFTSRR